jgi:integrase/recombinase XerD
MGDTELDTVTTQTVELFKNKALQKLTASAVSIYFRAIKSLLNRGIQMGLVTENPFLKARPVKIPHTPPDFLDDLEQALLLSKVKGQGKKKTESLRRLYVFLFHTGLRSGEAINLKVDDVDLKNKTIRVYASKTNTVRGVPLNKKALEAVTAEINGRTSGKIWTVTINGASNAFRRALLSAGITKNVSFYSTRHSFASNLVKKNVDISKVSRLMGHTTTALTSRYYLHLQTDTLADAVSALD